MVDLQNFEEKLRKETDLSLNEALCLCQADKGIQEPTALARELSLSPSRLTRILNSLESKGLIERTIGLEDRRNIALRVTHEGNTVVHKLHCSTITMPTHIEKAIENLHETVQSGEKS
jgi:DNA-binding MarR family transcriptional regulator